VIERLVGKGEYVLKGRDESGKWIEITRYSQRVTWADVSEEFEEDLCEKYDVIMLYNKVKRKPEWVKNCKPPVHRFMSTTQAMASAFNTFINMLSMAMTTMIQTQNTMLQMTNQIIAQLQSDRPSLADELAQAYQMIKVAKLLAQEAGGGGKGGDELDRIFALINKLRGLQLQAPQPSTPQSQPQVQKPELPPELKQKLEKVDRELEETLAQTAEELDEALAVCREVEGEECEPEAQ
jgi:hypothetical protein